MSEPVTFESLQGELTHVRRELARVEQVVGVRFVANDDALRLARENLEDRLEHQNGLLDMVRSVLDKTVTQAYYNAEHKELVRRVEVIEASRNELHGRNTVVWLLLGAVIAAEIAHIVIK